MSYESEHRAIRGTRALAAGQGSAKFFYKSVGYYHAGIGAANERERLDTLSTLGIVVSKADHAAGSRKGVVSSADHVRIMN